MGQEGGTKRRWLSTMDLLTMAAIAVVGAAFASYVWPALMNVATPVFSFLGPVGWIAVSGVYVIFPVLYGLLVAKPGATTIYAVLQGLIEILFGNPLLPNTSGRMTSNINFVKCLQGHAARPGARFHNTSGLILPHIVDIFDVNIDPRDSHSNHL